MKRLVKKSDDLTDLKNREKLFEIKYEINRLNKDLMIEKRDAEDAIGLELSDDLKANLKDQVTYITKRLYKTIDKLKVNKFANDYYKQLQNKLDEFNSEDELNLAQFLVSFIDEILQINNEYINMFNN
jgi:parvulin-like peptidyl-prolyl isomerase